jgi:hypothetical protein
MVLDRLARPSLAYAVLGALLCASSATTGCRAGAAGTGAAGGGANATSAGTAAMGSTGSGFGTSASTAQGGNTNCSAATQFVYTLSAANELYSFDPPTLNFALIGVLDCLAPGEEPYSMAVDRNANAWTVSTMGNLYNIDTKTAHCTPTTYAAGQNGWTTFGMGFAADTAGGSTDTLYVSEAMYGAGITTTKGLGKIDLTTMKLIPIGMYDQVNARAELTGTGDARLFGAFEGTPYNVVEIDKASAKILSQAPQNAITYAPDTSNFAFAAWGGDFWLFVGPGTSTDVFHYQVAAKTTTKVKTVSMEIVGAGVSTCAPFKPPT